MLKLTLPTRGDVDNSKAFYKTGKVAGVSDVAIARGARIKYMSYSIPGYYYSNRLNGLVGDYWIRARRS